MRRCDVGIRFAILCAEAWVLIPAFAVLLRLVPGGVMSRMRKTASLTSETANEAKAVAAAVNGAVRWLPSRVTTCLPRACAAHMMLTRRGMKSQLRIGVVKSPQGRVNAHAWVEAGGIDIGLDPASPSFVTLPVS